MKYMYLLLMVLIAILGLVALKKMFMHQPAAGMVIVLNGPSASGKSSIQKEFQKLNMPNLWIKVGIDNLFDAPMPDITPENMAFWQKPNPIRWVEITKDADDKQIVALFVGEQGDRVAYGMHGAIADYAKSGCNVIVDYIAYKKEWLDDLRNKLSEIKTIWVKVNIPLQTLEEREAARKTSPIGHARSHYNTVHWDIAYNMEVNSEKQSAAEIAHMIQQTIRER